MTTLTLTATDNATTQTPTEPIADTRRISELDADYTRLHTRTLRTLTASIQQLVRDLRTLPHPELALSPFIHRHTQLLRDAYDAGHVEGQRDYYERVSARPNRWLRNVGDESTSEATARTRLAWYGVSVGRMASEALQAYRNAASRPTGFSDAYRGTLLAAADTGDAGDELDQWAGGAGVRISLQADIVWPGLQDGYLTAGATDRAALYQLVYWLLEPLARHCSSCLTMAAGGPYNAPGIGGNELLAVPGDGHTECGANCKCSLSYEPQGALDQRLYDRFWNESYRPRNAPENALPTVSVPPPPPLTADAVYNDRQQKALDNFRAAAEEWDTVRGILPPAPDMFAADLPDSLSGSNALLLPAWDYLEPDQQQAQIRLYGALLEWGLANDTTDGSNRR